MARCSIAKPFCAATATPRLSRRRRHLAANAISPAESTSRARLPALKKPAKPPPPLLSRPKLPVPNDGTTATAGSEEISKKPSPEVSAALPSSSGAGDVLRLMDTLRVPPGEEVYISLLRDCADAVEVASVHAHIAVHCAAGGLPLPLANRVLLSYAACGDIGAARRVFDEMPTRNGMAWATMVSAYSDGCFHHEAMRLFAHMYHEARDLAGDSYAHAVVAVLRSCARAGELRFGEQLHAFIIKKDRVCGNIGSSLVQLYCESAGRHSCAKQVLVMMMRHPCQEPVPEAAWTSLITACHRDSLLNEAIDVFRDMVSTGVPRSSFSLSSILAVFAESQNQGCCGQQVHADAIKRGMDRNQFVGSGLVHMYAKQGQLADATRAFEVISGKPDAACWNAMAMAYARCGRYREATRVMYQMKAAGMNPSQLMTDAVRLACFRRTAGG
ncbi:pentatricopeptide repeat-containing protein At1g31790 [Phragmites australis]|uniref:pentatricopeptide repeat-containing protein At1g31790 n=1 Tax=Phragmites australis TaxID=29695 RepID=UPI002D786E4B|nr:pentatricopeptide repeat-containing protein At1g31790 [Phragmites australis]